MGKVNSPRIIVTDKIWKRKFDGQATHFQIRGFSYLPKNPNFQTSFVTSFSENLPTACNQIPSAINIFTAITNPLIPNSQFSPPFPSQHRHRPYLHLPSRSISEGRLAPR